jgi:hypothetical protein
MQRSSTITAGNLTGPLAGTPFADFIARLRVPNTFYVNVHTNDGVVRSGARVGVTV